MRKKVRRKTILIGGIRYYDDKPDSCRKCFWKNRKVGCVLGTQNCYYLAEAVKTEQKKKCVNGTITVSSEKAANILLFRIWKAVIIDWMK